MSQMISGTDKKDIMIDVGEYYDYLHKYYNSKNGYSDWNYEEIWCTVQIFTVKDKGR